MKTKLIIAAIILISSILLWNCSSDSSTDINENGSNNGVILPLSVGNKWTYELKYYTNNKLDSMNFLTYFIDSTYIFNNEIWYSLRANLYKGIMPLKNKHDGLYIYDPQDTVKPILWLKYPASIGDKWEIPTKGDTDSTIYEVESIDSSIASNIGIHICYIYSVRYTWYSNHTTTSTHYYEPNLGLIKEEIIDIDHGNNDRTHKTVFELLSYELK